MKTIGLLLTAVAAFALASSRLAQADTAVGLQFGYPGNVGLSARFDKLALSAAWSSDYLHATGDVWLKRTPMKEDDRGRLAWYYGVGGDVGLPFDSDHDFFLAGRVPVGLQFMLTPKFETFGELAPGLQVLHDLDFYLAACVGIRVELGGK